MALAELRIGQVAIEDGAEGVPVRNAEETERADQQMHVHRIEIGTEYPFLAPPLQDAGQRANHALVHVLDRGEIGQVFGLVNVFHADQADEQRMGLVVIERQLDQLAHGGARLHVEQLGFFLERSNIHVGFFEHRLVQAFLALEVVINHALRGARALGDLIDARAAQAVDGEFLGGDREDVLHRGLGSRVTTGSSPALAFFLAGLLMTDLVH